MKLHYYVALAANSTASELSYSDISSINMLCAFTSQSKLNCAGTDNHDSLQFQLVCYGIY